MHQRKATMLGKVHFIIALAVFFGSVRSSHADFIPRGQPPLTYISQNGKVALVVTHGIEGVFISYSASGSVQGFDPRQLNERDAKSIFMAFDRNKNTFSELRLASGRTYNIQGNINLRLGDAIVSLDKQGTSYLTVVSDSGPDASILGLSNQQPILNGGGASVAILKANALLDEKYKEVLREYVVEGNDTLSLGGTPFQGSQIGVSVESNNSCLLPGALILSVGDFAEYLKSVAAAKEGVKPDDFKKRALPVAQFQSLNVTPSFVAALDMQSGQLGVIKARDGSYGTVCTFSPITLEAPAK
jgi:hypothetical protein